MIDVTGICTTIILPWSDVYASGHASWHIHCYLCFQVLEELEKLKGHCRDCEMKNDTLQTERDALQQQLMVNVLLAMVRSNATKYTDLV